MKPSFVIDCFPERALGYKRGYAIVAVDVIRATTTIATVLSQGRRCFPVPSREAAWRLAACLPCPLLAGEVSGVRPAGFEMNNSPAELAARQDIARPLILLSSSGTRLIDKARGSDAVYMACLRNVDAVVRTVVARHSRVAIIGAGSRGDFRPEDQMCCAWVARGLLESGFSPETENTVAVTARWPPGSLKGILTSASAEYLIRSGQRNDLDFVLAHIGDLDESYELRGEEVRESTSPREGSAPTTVAPVFQPSCP